MKNAAICTMLGRRLRMRRRLLDLSQTEVAARCGLTFQQIHKYEAGLVDISISTLALLAAALDVSLAELCEGAQILAIRDYSGSRTADRGGEPARWAG